MRKSPVLLQINIIAFCILLLLMGSCSKDELSKPDTPTLSVSKEELVFNRLKSSQTVAVTSNIELVKCSVLSADWCNASYSNGLITVETTTNQGLRSRKASILVSAGELKKTITVSQAGMEAALDAIKDDIKITVKSGAASSFQPGSGIEKSFDGDFSTGYHSNWTNTAPNYFPITLTYSFEKVPTMDYLVYYPRTSGENGLFKEFELWIATETEPVLKKYGDYNFNGSSSPGKISFSPALVKPTTVQFIVKSGAGDRQGFAQCSEMQFFQKNPENFDFLSIFTDNSCSELKPGVSEASIQQIGNTLFRDLALEIFRKEYDSEFRIQNYKPRQHPRVMAGINRTSTYSLMDNPTGMVANAGEDLIFFANNPGGQNLSIRIQNLENGYGGSNYPVNHGLNKIKISSDGLIYVMYHTENATEQAVKINFVTGMVNGYFDSQKHKKEDWNRLLGKATDKHFDVLGQYAHLTFPTSSFNEYTPDGLALINKYDELVYKEQEFMGLFKYKKAFKNRMYFHIDYETSNLYATSYRTAYSKGSMKNLCTLEKFSTDVWGPAHEVGHSNQTRPNFKWIGMTEVTNNIMSLHIQTSFGNESRLVSKDTYSKAISSIVEAKIAHNLCPDVFCQLVPFWQLKLYLVDALGKTDFYKDLYEYMRNHDNSGVTNDGYYQLDFVRATCKIANLDLIEFFECWGFLYPIDTAISDYSTKPFVITKQQIDELKAEIAAKNYPKAPGNLFTITDKNFMNFK